LRITSGGLIPSSFIIDKKASKKYTIVSKKCQIRFWILSVWTANNSIHPRYISADNAYACFYSVHDPPYPGHTQVI
jgi:hypothetical protein